SLDPVTVCAPGGPGHQRAGSPGCPRARPPPPSANPPRPDPRAPQPAETGPARSPSSARSPGFRALPQIRRLRAPRRPTRRDRSPALRPASRAAGLAAGVRSQRQCGGGLRWGWAGELGAGAGGRLRPGPGGGGGGSVLVLVLGPRARALIFGQVLVPGARVAFLGRGPRLGLLGIFGADLGVRVGHHVLGVDE